MSAGPRSDGYVKPSLAKKPSSARVSPKASTKAFYVKPRSDGYVKPATAAAEAKAAKAANKAAKCEKQLEDVSDSPHREQAWTRREAARSTPAAQPPTSSTPRSWRRCSRRLI